jgi:uncharacterized membrane protein YagU involved in acid resistance
MNEKFIRSFIAGILGGMVKDAFDFISYYLLHFVNYRYLDFAAEILYGNKPRFWWDSTFAQFIELIFCGLLGVAYYVIIPKDTNKNFFIKGWLYGVFIWLFLSTLGMIYKIPYFTKVPWQTTNSDFITSSIFGVVLSGSLRLMDKKYENERSAFNER